MSTHEHTPEEKRRYHAMRNAANEMLDVVWKYRDLGMQPGDAIHAILAALRLVQRSCSIGEEELRTMFVDSVSFLKAKTAPIPTVIRMEKESEC